jgi:catechol 2,3-dioxygenase-like lactoylglutathione lyase family enzyme
VTEALRCELFPADLDASIAFYVRVLGFRLARDERSAPTPYAALERGSVRLGLAARPAPADPGPRRPPVGVELVLEVDDLAAEYDHVRVTGRPVDEEPTDRPWGLRDFRLLDPDGYYWRVTSRA